MENALTIDMSDIKTKMKKDEGVKYRILLAIASYLFFTSFLFDSPMEILKGSKLS